MRANEANGWTPVYWVVSADCAVAPWRVNAIPAKWGLCSNDEVSDQVSFGAGGTDRRRLGERFQSSYSFSRPDQTIPPKRDFREGWSRFETKCEGCVCLNVNNTCPSLFFFDQQRVSAQFSQSTMSRPMNSANLTPCKNSSPPVINNL